MGVPHKVRRTDSSISFSIHPYNNPPKPFADTYRTARTCYRENTSGCSKSRTGRRTWFPVQTVLGSSMLHLSIAPFLFLSGRITLCTTSIPPATAPAIYLYRNKRTTAPSPPATSLINNACDVLPRYSWTRHLKPSRYNLCDSMPPPLKLGTTVDLKASNIDDSSTSFLVNLSTLVGCADLSPPSWSWEGRRAASVSSRVGSKLSLPLYADVDTFR